MGRIMALDVGERWVGVAVSDPTRTIAKGIGVIDRKKEGFFKGLETLMGEYEVEVVVVGVPMDTRGGVSPFGEEVMRLARRIGSRFNVRVFLWNEAYTTKEAMRVVGGKGSRRDVDMVSAELILQGFLEKNRLC